MRDGYGSLAVDVVTISSEEEKEEGEVGVKEEVAAEVEEVVDEVEAEASVKDVEAAAEAGEEGDDEGSESDGSDFSLPSLYQPPTPTGLNTL